MKLWTTLILTMGLVAAGCTRSETIPAPDATPPAAWDVTPTQAPSAGQEPVAGNAADECGNPYYPVAEGAHWTYRIGETTATHTMTLGTGNTFVLNVEGDDTSFTIDGICTDEGIFLMDVPGMSTTATTSDGTGQVTTSGSEGVTLPNDVQVDDEWSQTISANVALGDSSMAVVIDTQYKAIGYETVTVPAGMFQALRVDAQSTLDMAGSKSDFTQTLWYAEGVGTVKSDVGGVASVELVSYEFP